MRTTVDLDMALLDEAMRRSGAASRRECLEQALELLIQQKACEELAGMFGVAEGSAAAPSRRRAR